MTQPPVMIWSREIPYPSSISEEAREKPAMMAAIPADAIERPRDTAGWNAMIGFVDDMLFATVAPPAAGTTVTPIEIGGVAAFEGTSPEDQDVHEEVRRFVAALP